MGERVGGPRQAGQQPQHRRSGGAGRGPVTGRVDQVPGGVALLDGEIGQQPVGLRGAERERPQPAVGVGAQQQREQRLAQPAVAVVDDGPVRTGG